MSSNKKIGNLCAFWGLVFIVGIMALNAITGWLKIDLGIVSTILELIKNLLILLAVGIGGYEYSATKNVRIKTIYWVAIILYLVFIFVGLNQNLFNF